MRYKSYQDLSDCIRRNVWKIPQDIDIIVGIPRSGMIPALMLAELMNKRCVDLDAFADGRRMSCGGRQRLMNAKSGKKVLVLDDTVFSGSALREAKKRLSVIQDEYDLLYGCVYAEGRNAKEMVDIYFEDIYYPGETTWLYEWNILHHYEKKTQVFMFDIDGLLCKDPPDDRDIDAYEAYLPNAIPMIIPTTEIGTLVTYRLEKYRDITTSWLERNGVKYKKLVMFNAPNRDIRNGTESPADYKARIYSEASWAKLFVESNSRQAERIHRLTGRPVFCYENGKMYL